MCVTKSNVVAPKISSGLARRKIPIVAGAIFLTTVYLLIRCLFPNASDTTFPSAQQQYCASDDEPCIRSDLLGIFAAMLVMQCYMASIGFLAWYYTGRAHTALPDTPEGRLFGYLEEADQLNAGIFLFQWCDFVVCVLVPELYSPIMVTHHVLAGLCAWFSLEYQIVHHYAIFFGGCSEISSVFLVICDVNEYFPVGNSVDSPLLSSFIFFCQVSFALTFFYWRVISWWIVSYRLWIDVLYVRKNNLVEQYRPGKGWFLYFFLLMDTLLGGLQLYWFVFEIVPKIMETL